MRRGAYFERLIPHKCCHKPNHSCCILICCHIKFFPTQSTTHVYDFSRGAAVVKFTWFIHSSLRTETVPPPSLQRPTNGAWTTLWIAFQSYYYAASVTLSTSKSASNDCGITVIAIPPNRLWGQWGVDGGSLLRVQPVTLTGPVFNKQCFLTFACVVFQSHAESRVSPRGPQMVTLTTRVGGKM